MTRQSEIDTLMAPLSADRPCGDALDGTALLARLEGTWPCGPWTASAAGTAGGDPDTQVQLVTTGLSQSKDLRLLVALAAIRLQTSGVPAFLDVLTVVSGWIDDYWDDLYPRPANGDLSARRTALERLNDPVAFIEPLVRGPLNAGPGLITGSPLTVETLRQIARAEEALGAQLGIAMRGLLGIAAAMRARGGAGAVPDLSPLSQALINVLGRMRTPVSNTQMMPPVERPPQPREDPAARPSRVTRGGSRAMPPAPTGSAPPVPSGSAPPASGQDRDGPREATGPARSPADAARFDGSAPPPPPPAATARTQHQGAEPPRPVTTGRTRGITRSATRPVPAAAGAPAPPSAESPAPAPAAAAPPAEALAEAPAPAPSTGTKIECHVLTEMDPEVVMNEATTVEVTLSREAVAAMAGRTSAGTGAVTIDGQTRLTVQIVPRANIVLAAGTESRVEVDPPAPGQPVLLYFDVMGAHEGDGEIWIIVRQRQMGVARLVLKPAVVASRSTQVRDKASAQAEAVQAPPLAQPLDQLDIFEQTIGNTVQYLFQLEMPSLNLLRLFTSPPLATTRDDYVAALYQEIETRHLSSYSEESKSTDVAAFTAQLQAQGVALFDRLFPFELQQMLWAHRDAIRSVRVVSTEPFIPWEIVHLREPGVALDRSAPMRFLGQMGLVRWLHNVNGLPPTSLVVRGAKARYVIPDYVDPRLKLPATVNERLFLEKTFAATAIEPQPMPLQDALATPGAFDLLHLACHGEADLKAIAGARLILQGRDEEEIVQTSINVSTVEAFANMRGADGVQPIVFLNACQAGRAGYQLSGIGGFAQAFLRGGAGAFIGTLWSVGDQPAFYFGKAFYEALDRGATLSEAAIAARDAARHDDATWLAYVVYGHPHARIRRA